MKKHVLTALVALLLTFVLTSASALQILNNGITFGASPDAVRSGMTEWDEESPAYYGVLEGYDTRCIFRFDGGLTAVEYHIESDFPTCLIDDTEARYGIDHTLKKKEADGIYKKLSKSLTTTYGKPDLKETKLKSADKWHPVYVGLRDWKDIMIQMSDIGKSLGNKARMYPTQYSKWTVQIDGKDCVIELVEACMQDYRGEQSYSLILTCTPK